MKIAVDIDGVILDLVVKVCEIFNRLHKTNYTKNEVTRWEFFRDWNIPEKEIFEIFEKAYEESMTIPTIDNNTPHVLQRINARYHVDLLTARSKTFEAQLINKLNSLKIIKGSHYQNLNYADPKPYDLKLNLDYDIFIDDNPNLVESIKKFPEKKVFLYDQPWNKDLTENNNVKRVFNWEQIESLII
jgi:uncharacterized HAD superfamily protein